jgi:hypothetical protein
MNNRQKALVSFTVLIVIVFGLYFFTDWFSQVTGYVLGENEVTKLAQCLDGKNSELYIGTNCKLCEQQKEEFGKALKFIATIECETNIKQEIIDEKCENLRSVPAWHINKTIIYGYKNISELQELSGCID